MDSAPSLQKIAIIGATGATGREIVKYATSPLPDGSRRVAELTLIIRKKLPEWEEQEANDPWFKENVKYVVRESFDDLMDLAAGLQHYNSFLCTLGTIQKHGKENFIKVDYQYPLNFATLAKNCNIPYFGLLTSTGANSKSMFFYMKTKGQVEDACRDLGLNSYFIYRPGAIVDRVHDDRKGEKVLKFIPFI